MNHNSHEDKYLYHLSCKKYRVPSISKHIISLPESKLIGLLFFLAFELSSFFTDVAFLKVHEREPGTEYTLTSLSIFTILFSMHFLSC